MVQKTDSVSYLVTSNLPIFKGMCFLWALAGPPPALRYAWDQTTRWDYVMHDSLMLLVEIIRME